MGMGGNGNVKSHSSTSLLCEDVQQGGWPRIMSALGQHLRLFYINSVMIVVVNFPVRGCHNSARPRYIILDASVCRFHAFGRCFLFPECFPVKCSVIRFTSFFPAIPSVSSVNRILCKLLLLFLFTALSPALNSSLHYRYFVTILKCYL